MIREIGFPGGKKTRNGGLQFVVHPDPSHGIVDGRIDHHGNFIGIVIGDLFVHLEKVPVLGLDHILAQPLDGILEIEEYSQSRGVHPESCIAPFFGSPGRHIPGHQVTESGVAPFQVIIPVFLGISLTR